MSRLKVPEFIHEVIDDPRQRGILIAGALSLFAVGLVPRLLSPGLPEAQEILRKQPEIANLFLLLSFVSAATVILGGLVSDLFRRRSLLVGGLAVMLSADALNLFIDDGPLFYLGNFTAIAASGVVLAYGIGAVAIAYDGVPRATALGIVYAAFGAGAAAAPAVLTLFPQLIPNADPNLPSDFSFDTWLAYLVAGIAAAVALWAAFRWMPRIPGTLPAPRRLITGVAIWAISILAIVTGVLGIRGAGGELLPLALIVGGTLGLSTFLIQYRRTNQEIHRLRLDMRGMGAALTVGVAVGFAQAVPLMLLPIVFEYSLGYGTLLAVVAIAPFAIALLVAGPVSGILLQRFGPRGMMASGTFMLGVANILLAGMLAVFGLGTHYVAFILPLAFIGAGFVLSTTVRTAIVFASTPRGLPASAAAINEASVSLGSRIGIVAGTTALAIAALDSARSMVAGVPQANALVEEFELALISLGTPRFKEILNSSLADASELKITAYNTAYVDGVEVALVISGVIGILGALIAWFLTGRRDPLKTVFDMQDERTDESNESGHADAPAAPAATGTTPA